MNDYKMKHAFFCVVSAHTHVLWKTLCGQSLLHLLHSLGWEPSRLDSPIRPLPPLRTLYTILVRPSLPVSFLGAGSCALSLSVFYALEVSRKGLVDESLSAREKQVKKQLQQCPQCHARGDRCPETTGRDSSIIRWKVRDSFLEG